MSLIVVEGVSKIFKQRRNRTLLRDHVRDLVAHGSSPNDGFYAIKDVSFCVDEKESVGLLGANGAGKSTILSLVCGLAEPDAGSIRVRGSIAPLLELGSGFHPDLTGRENLVMNAALLGLNGMQVRERFGEILAFSELTEFIDEPLRTYSSGMVLRLAFAIATHCNPSILIIDEVLSVGDVNFQQKCHNRIDVLRGEGKTFLMVTHSTSTIRSFCDRAIWLHQGHLVADGPASEIADAYEAFMIDPSQSLPAGIASGITHVALNTMETRKRRAKK